MSDPEDYPEEPVEHVHHAACRYAWSITVEAELAAAFEENWKQGSTWMQTQPGARGATLERATQPVSGLQALGEALSVLYAWTRQSLPHCEYLAIARWDTQQDRVNALTAARNLPDRKWLTPEWFGTPVEHGWLEQVAHIEPPQHTQERVTP